jgi:peptidoglycan hydrolase CwlO-like protein
MVHGYDKQIETIFGKIDELGEKYDSTNTKLAETNTNVEWLKKILDK